MSKKLVLLTLSFLLCLFSITITHAQVLPTAVIQCPPVAIPAYGSCTCRVISYVTAPTALSSLTLTMYGGVLTPYVAQLLPIVQGHSFSVSDYFYKGGVCGCVLTAATNTEEALLYQTSVSIESQDHYGAAQIVLPCAIFAAPS